jgi:hypothetical protein
LVVSLRTIFNGNLHELSCSPNIQRGDRADTSSRKSPRQYTKIEDQAPEKQPEKRNPNFPFSALSPLNNCNLIDPAESNNPYAVLSSKREADNPCCWKSDFPSRASMVTDLPALFMLGSVLFTGVRKWVMVLKFMRNQIHFFLDASHKNE